MALSDLILSDLERLKSRSLRFHDPISRKGAELGPMLLLTINRKPYRASLITSSLWTLSDLERSKSRSLRFQTLISHKGAEIGPMLLLSLGNPIWRVQWHHQFWPWVTLKGQSQGQTDFKALYLVQCCKWAELGHMLLLGEGGDAGCYIFVTSIYQIVKFDSTLKFVFRQDHLGLEKIQNATRTVFRSQPLCEDIAL